MMRQRIREQIRSLAAWQRAIKSDRLKDSPIPTYGGDSVINIPRSVQDENDFLQ